VRKEAAVVTAHTHTSIVPGCFRCDLNLDEVQPSLLHAHIVRGSMDCDGQIDRTYIEKPDPDEDPDDFRDRMTGLNLPAKHHMTAPDGTTFTIDVTFTVGGFRWSAPTEEGWVSYEVQWCEDECDLDESTYRDHRAEEAGY
jgi:hypothetical protein